MKKISVIIPLYNVEKYIDRCLQSVVNQSYKNLEIILVNDGSTDNTSKIINEWKSKDNRIKVIEKENGGPALARNSALQIMTGDYVAFIDSDDYIDSEYISVLVDSLESNNADLSCVSFTEVYENSNEVKTPTNRSYIYKFNSDDDVYNALIDLINYDKFPHVIWAKLYKVSVIREHNLLFCDTKISEDLYFNTTYICHIRLAILVDKPLYYYVKRESGSLTNNTDEFKINESKNVIKMIENYYENNSLLSDQKINFYYLYFVSLNKIFQVDSIAPKKDWQKAIAKIENKEYYLEAINYIYKNCKYYKKYYCYIMSDHTFRLLIKNYVHYNNEFLTDRIYPAKKKFYHKLSKLKYKVKR